MRNLCIKMSQKFWNICIHASLLYVYHMTEAVQAVGEFKL